jgi:delta 1-pyrroline-5-carboxylate dehydrogenase
VTIEIGAGREIGEKYLGHVIDIKANTNREHSINIQKWMKRKYEKNTVMIDLHPLETEQNTFIKNLLIRISEIDQALRVVTG